MHLELTDEQTAALVRELDQIIDSDRYPLSRPDQRVRCSNRRNPAPSGRQDERFEEGLLRWRQPLGDRLELGNVRDRIRHSKWVVLARKSTLSGKRDPRFEFRDFARVGPGWLSPGSGDFKKPPSLAGLEACAQPGINHCRRILQSLC
jgi:hypothetical protein